MAAPLPPGVARCPDESTARECLIASDADINVEATTSAVPPQACDEPTQPHHINLQHPDQEPLLLNIALLCARARSTLSGVIRVPPFPYFPTCWRDAMETSRQYQIPNTPRVISPSPTPSEAGSAKDGYFGPTTHSSTRKKQITSPPPIDEDSSSSDPDKRRARVRSRSPILEGGGRRRRLSGLTSRRQANGGLTKKDLTIPNGSGNGHLSPAAANKNYWREMSRSPSPLGLIPIHQKWRSFVCSRVAPCIIRANIHRSIAMKFLAKSSTSPSAS